MIKLKENATLKISTITLYQELFGRRRVSDYKYSVRRIRALESTLDTVGRIDSIKIEVRSKESPHNLAHFHVSAPGKIDAIYTIDPLEFFKGEIDSKSNKAVLKWAEKNKDTLITMWNDFNGYRIKVN